MPSSLVSTMHYDSTLRQLTIVYQNRKGTYRYFDVPAEEWAAFQAAPSKGTYLNQTFKARGYPYQKIARATQP